MKRGLTTDENSLPERLYFQISIRLIFGLRSQIATSSWGGRRTLPYAFTEQGVAMLSAVLKSDTAIKVSVQIINDFVAMRRFLSMNAQVFQRIDNLDLEVKKHNEQYPPITVKYFSKAHDRFLMIDGKTVYHFGASLKNLEKKWFAFSKMDTSAAEMLKEAGGLV